MHCVGSALGSWARQLEAKHGRNHVVCGSVLMVMHAVVSCTLPEVSVRLCHCNIGPPQWPQRRSAVPRRATAWEMNKRLGRYKPATAHEMSRFTRDRGRAPAGSVFAACPCTHANLEFVGVWSAYTCCRFLNSRGSLLERPFVGQYIKSRVLRNDSMGKRQRSDDVVHIRLFDVLNRSTLSELPRREFSKEMEMQELIENNIEELFPNLTFLKREFRGMGDGELRPDTIAFDTARNSFVALEYKKKPDKAVVDQARSYVHFMGKNKAELAILYNEQKNTSYKPNSFNWKEVYAIIMTPDFSDYQISGAEEDKKIELYKIRMHDHIIMMQRVGGDHQQASITGPAQKTHNRQSQKNTNPTAPDAGRRIEPARGGGVGEHQAARRPVRKRPEGPGEPDISRRQQGGTESVDGSIGQRGQLAGQRGPS